MLVKQKRSYCRLVKYIFRNGHNLQTKQITWTYTDQASSHDDQSHQCAQPAPHSMGYHSKHITADEVAKAVRYEDHADLPVASVHVIDEPDWEGGL